MSFFNKIKDITIDDMFE